MNPTVYTSIIGLVLFGTIMFFGYRFASGNWKVAPQKEEDYQRWVANKGGTVRKSIAAICIIYLVFMLLQMVRIFQTG